MDNNNPFAVISCKHCSAPVRYRVPGAQGVFRLTCPKCGGTTDIRIIPKELRMQNAASSDANLQDSTHTGEGPRQEIVSCPDCHTKMRFEIKSDGETSMNCPCCNASVIAKISDGKVVSVSKKQTKVVVQDPNDSKGKLTVVRYKGIFGSLANKTFPLHLGQNTVGRYDEDLHSDIEIKGDATMSRRSVVIDVIRRETGYLFKLKVLKAANPVMHNSKPLVEGETVYLNYGDSLKLGKTTFVFGKV